MIKLYIEVDMYRYFDPFKILFISSDIKGLFGTAPAPAPPLLELELSQTVSAPPKLVVELGLGSSTTPLQTQLLELNLGVGAVPNRP
uniref:Uncharacterized protein n=1 Tax=Oryza sativa subsp. japonica TaxID=39947 RepID=Q69MG9_ORYSJ|nr:hypothetical protein [Oryza sativa Japonica Group]BAD36324.1 hypothetical protein [Oryza sativa Japonica Group]